MVQSEALNQQYQQAAAADRLKKTELEQKSVEFERLRIEFEQKQTEY